MEPNCKCGEPASVQIVKKDGPTQGRPFFCCSKGRDASCGFFQWADQSTSGAGGQQQQRQQQAPRYNTNVAAQPNSALQEMEGRMAQMEGKVAALDEKIFEVKKVMFLMKDQLVKLTQFCNETERQFAPLSGPLLDKSVKSNHANGNQ
jgi:hypothetical protein